jgi:hypothetical protein
MKYKDKIIFICFCYYKKASSFEESNEQLYVITYKDLLCFMYFGQHT